MSQQLPHRSPPLSCLVLRKNFQSVHVFLGVQVVLDARCCVSLPFVSIVAKSAIARALRIRPKAAYIVGY